VVVSLIAMVSRQITFPGRGVSGWRLTPLDLAQSLEIEFAAKLDGATGLRIAAGIDRLIDGVD
jgi:hypothetical protein